VKPLASDAPFLYRGLQRFAQLVVPILARMDVVGLEHIPRTGAFILASNHLHVFDLPVMFTYAPRIMTVFMADKWRGTLGGWIVQLVTRTIYVARGEVDRRALGEALALLKAGSVLGVAPEGTRSRTGGLLQGQSGIIYLAGRAGVPIVPAVMWGQEQVMPGWLRLRRAPVHLHIGPPICLPPEAARFRTADLDAHTEQLMLTMARMLPAQYRGVYADMVDDSKV
jgi:1-acyl-sn-glycerol-3-phosphate acyltransferase